MTNKNKDKLLGVIMTVVFHAAAIILLLSLCFRTPLPLPGEAGVEVNLGMYAQGMGNASKPNVAPKPAPTKPKAEPAPATPSEDITSNDEEIPAIKPENKDTVKKEDTEKKEEIKEKETTEEKAEEKIEEKPVVNEKALFNVPKNNEESSSEGNTQQEGVQGSPNGLKDIDRYEGNGGSGGGPAYDLGGRGAKSISSPSKDFSEEGIVVVNIWVDKNGIVQKTEIGKGTTITNTAMRNSAIEAAKNSIFVKDENAADLQKGTITYRFIIRQ